MTKWVLVGAAGVVVLLAVGAGSELGPDALAVLAGAVLASAVTVPGMLLLAAIASGRTVERYPAGGTGGAGWAPKPPVEPPPSPLVVVVIQSRGEPRSEWRVVPDVEVAPCRLADGREVVALTADGGGW